eukprot:gnl/MRDRNA2_/MRDRNA2_92781_c0_seq1.p1 gnl/MRDRNA2_/MRDRNA2_92781_c0~~gnl/MRDRNA2_/MRDRNA2_92781_c0_seq1.p1  ORF type:complete len:211 (+),score=47.16 gnl/MRDRNA2_/MRDRNA2_92781_c0_seq1:143-775(+)
MSSTFRSLKELQDAFQATASNKVEKAATTKKAALRSLTDLQKDFQQKQAKALSAKAEPFFPSEDLANPGDASVVHELPCLLGRTMPESVMTDVMLAVLHQKLQDEKTPETCTIYSRNALLSAFRVLSDADCLPKENPGLASVQSMPRLQCQSKHKPRRDQKIFSKEDLCLSTAKNSISLPTFGDLKFEKASGDSTPTAAGDTASETFSEL